MGRKLSFVLLGFLLLGGVARADVIERKDLQVSNDVAKAVNRYAHFTIFDDVNAAVDNGVVTLTGKVTMPYKVKDIAQRVAKVDGVREVQNKITVLPVSGYDNQIRYTVARAIYRNPSLASYGLGPNPSIHIIVEHGRVTLTGVVNNDTDRMIARLAADRYPAMSVTNKLKTSIELRNAGEEFD